jgi:iron complex outermembrane receptor protein
MRLLLPRLAALTCGFFLCALAGRSADANYATSFAPNSLDTRTGVFFPAEDAVSYEAGLKFDDLWGGRLSGAFSAFEIKKRNVVRRDFNPVTFNFDPEITDDLSRGLEFDLFANLGRWNSILSYTWLDAKVTRSQSSAAGMRLESAAPQRLAVWTSYDFGALVKGLRAGGGGVWADGPIQQFGTSASRLVVEDGYTEASLFLRYATRLWQRKAEFGVNVANLTDVFYLRARAAVSDPRQVVFSVKLDL